MTLADNVQRLRITDGQTVEELAAATRLPKAMILSIENGRIGTANKAVRALARHFGVSVETLEA